ncbi:hypothetical protein [Aquirhabdus sp.]|uniref:hypothetical protein n=1 Tax=Aquirhabdus sp. TaxID=2824160 RepID=UPI00396CF4B1
MSIFYGVLKKRSVCLWSVLGLFAFTFSVSARAMSPLDEDAMSNVVGQAAFYTNYTAQTGSGAPGNTENFGFFTVGMQAKLDINANIQHLQLGCGGVNGPGCDIDINNLSLSGTPGVGSCPSGAARASCDATLTNPFLQIAIKNPTSLSTRQIVGFNLGAQSVAGLLTTGQNDGTANGINTLSGYLPIASSTGTAQTQAAVFGTGAGQTVTGKVDINILLCTTGCGSGKGITTDPSQSAGLSIPSMNVPFTTVATTVSGTRLTSAPVVANAIVPDIPITPSSGSLYVNLNQTVCVAFLICLSNTKFQMTSTIQNLGVKINFSEGLGYIHNLPLSGNGLGLSLQSQAIRYPGRPVDDIAQPGWWLAVQNPLNLGVLNPQNKVDISSAFPQLATILSAKLNAGPPYLIPPIDTGQGLQALVSGYLTATVPPINLSGSVATIGLSNLPLDGNQNVKPNCYGTLKFC